MRLIALIVVLIFQFGQIAFANEYPDNPKVMISVSQLKSGPKIQNNFIGLSYEKSKLATPFFRSQNQGVVSLVERLGNGVLRIGAESADFYTWNPNGKGQTVGEISTKDILYLRDFLEKTHMTVIYGINLANNSPSLARDEALAVRAILGSLLESFEIGNEPDLYFKRHRSANYKYHDYSGDWERLASSIRSLSGQFAFVGPSTVWNLQDFTLPFVLDHGREVEQITHHYYRGDGQSPDSTMEVLLKPDEQLLRLLDSLHQAALPLPRAYRIAETNSFYNGGRPGVSNAFGAALWSINFMMDCAIHGAWGVNFHGGNGPGPNGGIPGESAGQGYTPLADDGYGHLTSVRPVYYGLYMFSQLGGGKLLETKSKSTHDNLRSLAVELDNGTIGILLTNISETNPESVELNFDQQIKISGFSRLDLTAPKLDSTDKILLGGNQIDIDGQWKGKASWTSVLGAKLLVIDLKPASAVFLKILPSAKSYGQVPNKFTN